MRNVIMSTLAGVLFLSPTAIVAQAPTPSNSPRPAVPAQRPAQVQAPQVPPAAAMLVLVRSTMLALDQANKTNVYHVFYGLGSDAFRASTTPDKLAAGFAPFRTRNVDMSPVAILAPQLSRPPAIEGNKLHLVGFFPSSPLRIVFDIYFEPSQGRWKMARADVSLTQAPPQPAQQQGQRPPQPKPKPTGR